ncbi:MAG TPA: competence/damage-inducible protein A [Lachnospiraceae bacterium]|nr:competence/damage-inducible protein A [Lachnospiraceae bacterium]
MTAEIVCVGTEILLGNIVNTNAVYMASGCAEAGMACYYQTVVGDNPERMEEAIKTALGRADIVLINGGLGPTPDDLTTEVAARVFGRKLIMDAGTKEHLIKSVRKYLDTNPLAKFTENNYKMAMVPEGSVLLENANGQAPGIILEDHGKTAILLPGPPNEFRPMFKNQVMPYLMKKSKHAIVSRTVKIVNLGESMVAARIDDLIQSQTNPTIATYAKTGEVHIRITASAGTPDEAEKLLLPLTEEIERRFGNCIFTENEEETLEESCVRLLKERVLTLTTAESCTGGMVASRIVGVAGASDVFLQGLVTYSNEAKKKYLGVNSETLEAHGAVSPETAFEMASHGCKNSGTDVCLATTGIAGPGGGTPEKPVGLVYIACCIGGRTAVKKLNLSGSREKIRTQSAQHALILLHDCILGIADFSAVPDVKGVVK